MKIILMSGKEYLHYYDLEGRKNYGPNPKMFGIFAELWGDCSHCSGDVSHVTGNMSGIKGDLSNFWGELSGLILDLNKVELTQAEKREEVVHIKTVTNRGVKSENIYCLSNNDSDNKLGAKQFDF